MTKEEKAAYQKAYRAEHKESLAAYQKVYQKKNKTSKVDYDKAYYVENKEAIGVKQKAYNAENKESKAAYDKIYNTENKEAKTAYRAEHKELIAANQGVYYAENKDKMIANQKVYYAGNKGKVRWTTIMRKYGITEQGYNNMFAGQDGSCAICGTHQSGLKEPLHVDHNHVTGEVRGLLCKSCNTGIGLLKENEEILRKAIDYLAVPLMESK